MYSVMGKGKYYFTAWKTGRYHLNQIITVNITRSRRGQELGMQRMGLREKAGGGEGMFPYFLFHT